MNEKKNVAITESDLRLNPGVDMLRIVAMYAIVILHIMKHGGILDKALGSHFYAIWLLQAIVICAVDCYALISGYVGYSEENIKKSNYRKALSLWLQVAFYSAGLYIVVSLIGGGI